MALQAQSTAMTSKADATEDLIYHITHDLRAPLRALKTLPGWIAEDLETTIYPIPDNVVEHLKVMHDQASLMDQMILDLRDFSRVGRMSSTPTEVELETLIRKVALDVSGAAKLALTLDLSVPHIRAPRNDLALLFEALLKNAVQHHDRKEASVTVRSASMGDCLSISVSDDGPGIKTELRETAFGLMTTLYRRDEGAGSGIGLALARRIVSNLGGEISLEDAPGERGLDVQMTLPTNRIGIGSSPDEPSN